MIFSNMELSPLVIKMNSLHFFWNIVQYLYILCIVHIMYYVLSCFIVKSSVYMTGYAVSTTQINPLC